jgi:hypothetical protein
MHYLVVANLLLSAVLIVAVIGVGLFFYLKRRRRKQASLLPGDPSRDYSAPNTKRRSAGRLNYSSFVYLDVDRDGRYSVGDRPMGGIMVRLSGSGGHLLSSRTNGNGFANFTMSTRARKAQIRSAASYRFAVSIPPGWVSTSGGEVQTMPFELIEGSPAGIGSAEMVKPVGIAPVRFVRGQTVNEAATLSFTKKGEQLLQESLKPNSRFNVNVPDGADTVTVDGIDFGRTLTLSTYPTDLGALSPQRQPVGADAVLETIDFNEVTPRGLRKIPSGYAGLNWFNLNAISRDFQGGNEGYVNGNTSGDHLCYTSSGHPGELWSDRPFGFHSVMISAAWLRSEGELAKIESWRGDVLVAVDEIAVSALTPVQYAPMLKDVTRIRFSSKHYWQLAIDDLAIVR